MLANEFRISCWSLIGLLVMALFINAMVYMMTNSLLIGSLVDRLEGSSLPSAPCDRLDSINELRQSMLDAASKDATSAVAQRWTVVRTAIACWASEADSRQVKWVPVVNNGGPAPIASTLVAQSPTCGRVFPSMEGMSSETILVWYRMDCLRDRLVGVQ